MIGAPASQAPERRRAMDTKPATARRIKTRHTLQGVILEMDRVSWAEMMTALGVAIEHAASGDEAAKLRALRSALSRG